jgi:hypothetical protein
MESEADFKSFKFANLLPKEILHPKIADPVWCAFMREEFDVAAFQAMKAVEVSVRAASGLADNLIGVKLMREAFAPETGRRRTQTPKAAKGYRWLATRNDPSRAAPILMGAG